MDILDLKRSQVDDRMLGAIVAAIEKVNGLKKSRPGLLKDFKLYHILLQSNSIADGALVGRLLSLTAVRRADLSNNFLGSAGASLLGKELPVRS